MWNLYLIFFVEATDSFYSFTAHRYSATRGPNSCYFFLCCFRSVSEKQRALLEEFAREELIYENSTSEKENW